MEPKQETPKAETPRQTQIHTLIMVLDLAGHADRIFRSAKPLHVQNLRNMLQAAQTIQAQVVHERDLARRMKLNDAVKAHYAGAQAFKDLMSAVEMMGIIGAGNIDEMREGIEALQKECGCPECLESHNANVTARLTDGEPRQAPRFTGRYSEWVQRIIGEQKARAEEARQPKIIT